MDLAERLVSASEPGQVGTGVEQQVASGDEIAQRVIREAGQKEIGGTEREIRTSSQREHNLSNSNALLTSALFSSRPKKLIGEINQKTQQLLKELAVILIQRIARGYICRRSLKITRLVSIIKDQLGSSFAIGIIEETVLKNTMEIATSQLQNTEAAREV